MNDEYGSETEYEDHPGYFKYQDKQGIEYSYFPMFALWL